MNNTAAALFPNESDLVEYRSYDQKIDAIEEECKDLKVLDVKDTKGYEIVKRAHIEVKDLIADVEKVRTELKAPILARGRMIDDEAKRIQARLIPIAERLETERKRVDGEKARIAKEKQDAIDARNRERMKAFAEIEHVPDFTKLVMWTDEHFQAELAAKILEYKERKRLEAEETARKAKEEADRKAAIKAEQERLDAARKAMEAELAAFRAEQERVAREQREAQAKIDAENARITREKAESERKETEAKAKVEREAREAQIAQEAAERAKAEAEAKAQAEEERKAKEALAAEAKRKAIEAAKPDADKLQAWIDAMNAVERPVMATEAGKKVMADAKTLVMNAFGNCDNLIKAMR